MNIYELRNMIDGEIIDYNQLKAALHNYAHSRGKISKWLQTGELIRVKKGLYIFGHAVRRGPYNLELLANLIYGPSAISLNYALSYYGLIPEAVHTVTSITSKRNKVFNTPIGDFTYTHLHPKKYGIGIQLQMLPNNTNFMIASPEKALCDTILLSVKNLTVTSEQEVKSLLLDDLRIDEYSLMQLSMPDIKQISICYNNMRLNKFVKYLEMWMDKYE